MTVNRWENGKAESTDDYSHALYTLQQLVTNEQTGQTIDWTRGGAVRAMAAIAGFSPIVTCGAILAPQVLARLPSRDEALLNRTRFPEPHRPPHNEHKRSVKR